jgi:hypothetical protein
VQDFIFILKFDSYIIIKFDFLIQIIILIYYISIISVVLLILFIYLYLFVIVLMVVNSIAIFVSKGQDNIHIFIVRLVDWITIHYFYYLLFAVNYINFD